MTYTEEHQITEAVKTKWKELVRHIVGSQWEHTCDLMSHCFLG